MKTTKQFSTTTTTTTMTKSITTSTSTTTTSVTTTTSQSKFTYKPIAPPKITTYTMAEVQEPDTLIGWLRRWQRSIERRMIWARSLFPVLPSALHHNLYIRSFNLSRWSVNIICLDNGDEFCGVNLVVRAAVLYNFLIKLCGLSHEEININDLNLMKFDDLKKIKETIEQRLISIDNHINSQGSKLSLDFDRTLDNQLNAIDRYTRYLKNTLQSYYTILCMKQYRKTKKKKRPRIWTTPCVLQILQQTVNKFSQTQSQAHQNLDSIDKQTQSLTYLQLAIRLIHWLLNKSIEVHRVWQPWLKGQIVALGLDVGVLSVFNACCEVAAGKFNFFHINTRSIRHRARHKTTTFRQVASVYKTVKTQFGPLKPNRSSDQVYNEARNFVSGSFAQRQSWSRWDQEKDVYHWIVHDMLVRTGAQDLLRTKIVEWEKRQQDAKDNGLPFNEPQPRIVLAIASWARSKLVGQHFRGTMPAPVKKLLDYLKRRFEYHIVPEKYTTKTHFRCGNQTLGESYRRLRSAATLNHKGRSKRTRCQVVNQLVHGLKYCASCNEYVNRDDNAAINVLSIFLAARQHAQEQEQYQQQAATASIPPIQHQQPADTIMSESLRSDTAATTQKDGTRVESTTTSIMQPEPPQQQLSDAIMSESLRSGDAPIQSEQAASRGNRPASIKRKRSTRRPTVEVYDDDDDDDDYHYEYTQQLNLHSDDDYVPKSKRIKN